jgi:hypothetical protein
MKFTPMTINLPQELIERLRKEKEDNPRFRSSHLIEDLLIKHYSLEESTLKEELAQLGQFPPIGHKFWVGRLPPHVIKSKQKQIDELKQKESKA